MISKVFINGCTPSKVDLLSIKRSFVSTFACDVSEVLDEEGGCHEHKSITIADSSIGFSVVLDAGVSINKSVVPPQTHVSSNLVNEDDGTPQQAHQHDADHACGGIRPRGDDDDDDNWRHQILHELQVTVYYVLNLVLLFASLMPSYEVWMNWCKPQTSLDATAVLMLCLIVQTCVWILTLRLLGLMTYGWQSLGASSSQHGHAIETELKTRNPRDATVTATPFPSSPDQDDLRRSRNAPWNVPLHSVYLGFSFAVQLWWILPLLWGTPMMKYAMITLGCDVRGRRLLYFGNRLYDFHLLTFADRTIVDESHVTGHYGVLQSMTLGRCYVSGVLHRNCFVMANSVVRDEQSGPNRVILGEEQT